MTQSSKNPRAVWVVHGRDERLRRGVFDFLRSIGLQPLEFSQARERTGQASPYVGDILEVAFDYAQAIVVLLTPDDEARLRPNLQRSSDPPYEKELTGQARPNVIFEAGMALVSHRDRTVLVQIGDVRPFSDVVGRHVVRLDGSVATRQDLASRLKTAGCLADLSGTDWHTAGDLKPSSESSLIPDVPAHTRSEFSLSLTVEGKPPSQFIKLEANKVIKASRLDYLLTSDACIVSEALSLQGDSFNVPLNDFSVTKVWNTPRPDRNHSDHSGPAKLGLTILVDGKTRNYILPIQMDQVIYGSSVYRKIIGSRTFHSES